MHPLRQSVRACPGAAPRPRLRSFIRMRTSLPVSALAGACLVLGSDDALRALVSSDQAGAVPTGAVTSLVGALFLIGLALRVRDSATARSQGEGDGRAVRLLCARRPCAAGADGAPRRRRTGVVRHVGPGRHAQPSRRTGHPRSLGRCGARRGTSCDDGSGRRHVGYRRCRLRGRGCRVGRRVRTRRARRVRQQPTGPGGCRRVRRDHGADHPVHRAHRSVQRDEDTDLAVRLHLRTGTARCPARLVARFGPVGGATVLVGSVFDPSTWISSDRHSTGSSPGVDCDDPPLYGPNGWVPPWCPSPWSI